VDTVCLPLEVVPTVKQTQDAVQDNAGKMETGVACANKVDMFEEESQQIFQSSDTKFCTLLL